MKFIVKCVGMVQWEEPTMHKKVWNFLVETYGAYQTNKNNGGETEALVNSEASDTVDLTVDPW